MTLKEIMGMFEIGSVWFAENTYTEAACGPRALREKRKKSLVWEREDGKILFMDFPKKSQVVEASDGVLKFKLWADRDYLLTLRRS